MNLDSHFFINFYCFPYLISVIANLHDYLFTEYCQKQNNNLHYTIILKQATLCGIIAMVHRNSPTVEF